MVTLAVMSDQRSEPAGAKRVKPDDETTTMRLGNETARLIRTLSSWHDCTPAEFCTDHLNDTLRRMISAMVEEGGRRKPKGKADG